MPEGDTIFRAARTLDKALRGETVTSFRSELAQLAVHEGTDRSIVGRRIEAVHARGKHLLIDFERDLTIRTHMRMSGSWHIYRQGERWRNRRSAVRIVVETTRWVAVGFSIVEAELLSTSQVESRSRVERLGPDLLDPNFDPAEAIRRIRRRPELEIAVALLNQTLISGIGNVFKSEILFVAGINPFCRVGELEESDLERIVAISRDLLGRNVRPGAHRDGIRTTTTHLDPSVRVWVYRRRGKPCRRCDSLIMRKLQGEDARSTYWCERCQPSTLP